MQSNSKVIGVVVCIVCCIGALCILPLAGSSDNDLQGWNSSQMYDGLINPSDSEFFTDAVLEERANGGLASTPHISSTGSRMFHHSSASTMSATGMGMGSSYAGATVHTTSSAAMSGTGSSISPISTSTATGSMSGSSMGGGAIYATSNSVSPRSGSASGSSLISSSALSAPTASRAAAPMMSASSATSGNPSAMYASNISSNYGNASYGSSRMGVKGASKLPPTIGGDYWVYYNSWLNSLIGKEGSGWLYGYETGYFSEEQLRKQWESFMDWLDKQGDLPSWWNPDEYNWEHFWGWFTNYGGEGSYLENHQNEFYRLPLPDGVGVLLVLSLLCVLFTYLRSRDKKILEESNNQ